VHPRWESQNAFSFPLYFIDYTKLFLKREKGS
jgi:hypothetical protein